MSLFFRVYENYVRYNCYPTSMKPWADCDYWSENDYLSRLCMNVFSPVPSQIPIFTGPNEYLSDLNVYNKYIPWTFVTNSVCHVTS